MCGSLFAAEPNFKLSPLDVGYELATQYRTFNCSPNTSTQGVSYLGGST